MSIQSHGTHALSHKRYELAVGKDVVFAEKRMTSYNVKLLKLNNTKLATLMFFVDFRWLLR